MEWGEFFGGLALLALAGWLTALAVASLMRGGMEAGVQAINLLLFGGCGLFLMFIVGVWLTFGAF